MPAKRGLFSGRSQKPANPFFALLGNSPKQSSGLLSMFLGGNKSLSRGLFGQSRSTSGFGNIAELVSNTQKAINTAQKAMPMMQQVKQYGPLIRNMPSMYKMIKAINASEILSDDEVAASQPIAEVEQHEATPLVSPLVTKRQPIVEKKSLPKIFVP